MKEKIKAICVHCGAPMVTYKIGFSKTYYRALKAIWKKQEPTNLRNLNLSNAEYAQICRLKYWGLATNENSDKGRGGLWEVTEEGKAFLLGQKEIPKYVYVRRRQVTGTEGPHLKWYEMEENTKWRGEYVEEKKLQIEAQGNGSQADLFS